MKRQSTIGITSLVLLVTLGIIWWEVKPDAPPVDPAFSTALGTVLAEEAATAVHDQGAIVAVMYGDPAQPPGPPDSRLATFQTELKKHRAIRLATTEFVQPNPNANNGLPGCPSPAFAELLQRHSTAAAIVFFMEIPEWSRVKSFLPQSPGPKLIALVNGGLQLQSRYGGYFVNSRLAALVIRRKELGPEPADRTPRKQFDKYYQVITPQNYNLLPE